MNSFRQTLLSLCTACVLGAVVQGILPEKAQKPGINVVLLLYILSTALQFRQSVSFPDFWEAATADIAAYSYAEYTEGLYRAEVEQALRNALTREYPGASLRLDERNICLVSGASPAEARRVLLAAGWQGEVEELS